MNGTLKGTYTPFKKSHILKLYRNFYAKIAQCSAENLSNDAIYYTQELLGKMFRQGNEGKIESIFIKKLTIYARYCDGVNL